MSHIVSSLEINEMSKNISIIQKYTFMECTSQEGDTEEDLFQNMELCYQHRRHNYKITKFKSIFMQTKFWVKA